MVRDKVTISPRTLQWKCVESRTDSKRLYYSRFILAPLLKGQADTIGIAMRRALLAETEGTCITRAKLEKIPHAFSTIIGIQESVHEILMNLKAIVLRSNLYGPHAASICVKGPREVTAQDIILPTSVEIIDNTQHIASLKEPIDLYIELEIERNRGYRRHLTNAFQDGSYPIDAIFMPVITVNYSVHSYGNGNANQEMLFLEIWTNGSLTPKEALHEASRNLIHLFIPFLHTEEENFPEGKNFSEELNQHRSTLPLFTFHDILPNLMTNKKELLLRSIFIDQCEFPPKIYNCLKNKNIHTLWDLLSKSEEDLLTMEHFGIEDLRQLFDKIVLMNQKIEILKMENSIIEIEKNFLNY